jgi:hypothetical protein
VAEALAVHHDPALAVAGGRDRSAVDRQDDGRTLAEPGIGDRDFPASPSPSSPPSKYRGLSSQVEPRASHGTEGIQGIREPGALAEPAFLQHQVRPLPDGFDRIPQLLGIGPPSSAAQPPDLDQPPYRWIEGAVRLFPTAPRLFEVGGEGG